jgi:hypothetical protein
MNLNGVWVGAFGTYKMPTAFYKLALSKTMEKSQELIERWGNARDELESIRRDERIKEQVCTSKT